MPSAPTYSAKSHGIFGDLTTKPINIKHFFTVSFKYLSISFAHPKIEK